MNGEHLRLAIQEVIDELQLPLHLGENDPAAQRAIQVFVDPLLAGSLECVADMVELFKFEPGTFNGRWSTMPSPAFATVPAPLVELDDIDLTNATCELRPEVWDE